MECEAHGQKSGKSKNVLSGTRKPIARRTVAGQNPSVLVNVIPLNRKAIYKQDGITRGVVLRPLIGSKHNRVNELIF